MILQSNYGNRPNNGAGSLNTNHPLANSLYKAIVCDGTNYTADLINGALITYSATPAPISGTESGFLGWKGNVNLGNLNGPEPTIRNQTRVSFCVVFQHNSAGSGFLCYYSELMDSGFANYIGIGVTSSVSNYVVTSNCNAASTTSNVSTSIPILNGKVNVIVVTIDTLLDIHKVYLNGRFIGSNTTAIPTFGSTLSSSPFNTILGQANNDKKVGGVVSAIYTWRNRILTQEDAYYLTANPLGLLKSPQYIRYTFASAFNPNYQFSDSIAISDNPLIVSSDSMALSDSFTILDNVIAVVPISLLVDDSFTVTDGNSIDIIAYLSLLADDSFSISDGLTQNIAFQLLIGDQFSIGDTLVYTLLNFLVIQTRDALFIFDSVKLEKKLNYSDQISDSLAISDTSTIQLGMNLSFGEDINNLLDEVNGEQPPSVLTLDIGDSISLLDTVDIATISSFASSLRRYLNDVPSPRS